MRDDVVLGAFIAITADLVTVPDLEVQREHLKEVQDFDGGLVGELPHRDAVVAKV